MPSKREVRGWLPRAYFESADAVRRSIEGARSMMVGEPSADLSAFLWAMEEVAEHLERKAEALTNRDIWRKGNAQQA